MRKRRILSAILAMTLSFSMSVSAFASDLVQVPTTAPYNEEMIIDPTQADIIDIIEGAHMRGNKKPTEFFNLDGRTYGVSGTFDTSIYTSYYFYPNAQGELFYNMTFEWQAGNISGFPNVRGATVECWDKTTNTMVTDDSFDMKLQANGLYGLVIETGGWRVFNLNPQHQYYFRFTKSYDGFNAKVTGTIHT